MLLDVTYERIHGRRLFPCEDPLQLPSVVGGAPLAVVAVELGAPAAYINAAAAAALECTPDMQQRCSGQQLLGKELDRIVGLVGASSVPLQLKAAGSASPEPLLLGSVDLRSLQGRPLQAWGVEAMPIDSPSGSRIGVALAFKLWQYQDGRVAMPSVPPTRPADLPTAEALEAAVVAVHSQAESIRALKRSGLSNSDAAVKDAVAGLQELKRRLADMEALQRLTVAVRLERPHLLDPSSS